MVKWELSFASIFWKNGYLRVIKIKGWFFFDYLKQRTSLCRKNIKRFSKRSLHVIISPPMTRHCIPYHGYIQSRALSYTHALYYCRSWVCVISNCSFNFKNIPTQATAKSMPWILQCLWNAQNEVILPVLLKSDVSFNVQYIRIV